LTLPTGKRENAAGKEKQKPNTITQIVKDRGKKVLQMGFFLIISVPANAIQKTGIGKKKESYGLGQKSPSGSGISVVLDSILAVHSVSCMLSLTS
jgi:hypothetical protein